MHWSWYIPVNLKQNSEKRSNTLSIKHEQLCPWNHFTANSFQGVFAIWKAILGIQNTERMNFSDQTWMIYLCLCLARPPCCFWCIYFLPHIFCVSWMPFHTLSLQYWVQSPFAVRYWFIEFNFTSKVSNMICNVMWSWLNVTCTLKKNTLMFIWKDLPEITRLQNSLNFTGHFSLRWS